VVKLKVWAKVEETESENRVETAILSLFPGKTVDCGEGRKTLGIEKKDLEKIREIFRVKKIGKTALKLLEKNERPNFTKIMFNKQAAFAGRVVLVDSYDLSPLGAVVLEIKDYDDDFLAWFTGFSRSQESSKPRRKDSSE
jgi:predicted RNA binding protein with dsRBD fold (UPF0201 family)